MAGRLSGKVAVVTGAGSTGFGRGIVVALAHEGANADVKEAVTAGR